MTLGESVIDKKAIKKFQSLEYEFNQIHKYKYSYDKSVYINSHTKIKIICPIHGEFMQSPSSHRSGVGCKLCSLDERRYNTETFIEQAVKIHGVKFDYSQVNYINSSSKLTIICKKHGNFEISGTSHLYGKGGCKLCMSYSTSEFIDKANEIHNNKFDYSETKYVNYNTDIIITCPTHGKFLTTPANHLSSLNGCSKCGDINSALGRAHNLESFISKAIEKHGVLYKYDEVNYVRGDTKVNIICPIHGIFSQEANSHIQGSGCPHCAKLNQLNCSKYLSYKDKPVTLYYVCINESFWKLGLTKTSVNKRFKDDIERGIDVQVVFSKVFSDGWEAYLIEQKILNETSHLMVGKLESPILGGWTEVRRKCILNNILNNLKEIK